MKMQWFKVRSKTD